MKSLFLAFLLVCSSVAFADSIDLPTPYTVALSTPVHTATCYAETETVRTYSTAVTGFSADGNYVTGQAPEHFTCGHSGRGSNIHTYYSCLQLMWDLSGNLVSAIPTNVTDSNGIPVNSSCPDVALTMPSDVPGGQPNPVVGNSFTNAGGYTAETILVQPCGSIACYGLPYYYPTLITP